MNHYMTAVENVHAHFVAVHVASVKALRLHVELHVAVLYSVREDSEYTLQQGSYTPQTPPPVLPLGELL